MLIFKKNIRANIEKAKLKERTRVEKEYEVIIDRIEREHRNKIKRIHEKYHVEIQRKNEELKDARKAWDKYKDKILEFSELVFKLRNFTKMCEINTMELFKYSSAIHEGVERAERFITNNEAKIITLLGMEKYNED